jgi:hypothetical protein
VNAADKKRWAILPPPSQVDGEPRSGFSLQQALRERFEEQQRVRDRHSPARRAISGRVQKTDFYEQPEPSDSERVTEIPGEDSSLENPQSFVENRQETIPAPPLEDEQP